jgi:hypothetical protein
MVVTSSMEESIENCHFDRVLASGVEPLPQLVVAP